MVGGGTLRFITEDKPVQQVKEDDRVQINRCIKLVACHMATQVAVIAHPCNSPTKAELEQATTWLRRTVSQFSDSCSAQCAPAASLLLLRLSSSASLPLPLLLASASPPTASTFTAPLLLCLLLSPLLLCLSSEPHPTFTLIMKPYLQHTEKGIECKAACTTRDEKGAQGYVEFCLDFVSEK